MESRACVIYCENCSAYFCDAFIKTKQIIMQICYCKPRDGIQPRKTVNLLTSCPRNKSHLIGAIRWPVTICNRAVINARIYSSAELSSFNSKYHDYYNNSGNVQKSACREAKSGKKEEKDS